MIYLDVTRLLTWQGNYTGMERFAYEVTQNILRNGDENVRLCANIPGMGFKDIHDTYGIVDNRLVSSVLDSQPGVRQVLRQNKKAFPKQYLKRNKLIAERKKLQNLSSDATIIVYDGLWDNQEYIQSLQDLAFDGVRVGHVVHDLAALIMPHVVLDYVTDALRGYFTEMAPHIDVLYSISKNTEKDFTKQFDSLCKKSLKKVVIRHGEDFSHTKAQNPTQLTLKPQEFLLVVGTVEVRKNHYLLYQAYRLAAERGIKLPPLVIVGREGWLATAAVDAMRKDTVVKDRFIFAGPVTDSELAWLYENCLFTVFPALYEGWGLPVAESLFYGKVCAASTSSSIPEIGGDTIPYYSPYDPAECLSVVAGLLEPKNRKSYEKRIAGSYQPTKWSDTAATIVQTAMK